MNICLLVLVLVGQGKEYSKHLPTTSTMETARMVYSVETYLQMPSRPLRSAPVRPQPALIIAEPVTEQPHPRAAVPGDERPFRYYFYYYYPYYQPYPYFRP